MKHHLEDICAKSEKEPTAGSTPVQTAVQSDFHVSALAVSFASAPGPFDGAAAQEPRLLSPTNMEIAAAVRMSLPSPLQRGGDLQSPPLHAQAMPSYTTPTPTRQSSFTGSILTPLLSRPPSPGFSADPRDDPLWWESAPIISRRRTKLMQKLEAGICTLEPPLDEAAMKDDEKLPQALLQNVEGWRELVPQQPSAASSPHCLRATSSEMQQDQSRTW